MRRGNPLIYSAAGGGGVAVRGAGAAAGASGRRVRQRRVGRWLSDLRSAFRKGLGETGYVDGQNVTVEYHWLEGQYDQLASLMTDLVRRRVAVIATPALTRAAIAAKAATATIPIVFGVGRRPGQTWSRRQPQSAGGQRDRASIFSMRRPWRSG